MAPRWARSIAAGLGLLAAGWLGPALGALPRSNPPAWRQQVTIHELLTRTAGFGSNSPAYPPLKFQPGTVWFYSNGSANWLADTVLLAYGRDLRDVFEQRILDPI